MWWPGRQVPCRLDERLAELERGVTSLERSMSWVCHKLERSDSIADRIMALEEERAVARKLIEARRSVSEERTMPEIAAAYDAAEQLRWLSALGIQGTLTPVMVPGLLTVLLHLRAPDETFLMGDGGPLYRWRLPSGEVVEQAWDPHWRPSPLRRVGQAEEERG